ncbi:MAG: ABC transporter ATP-binding protein [Pseudolabrys sp.]|nr:ABC transporter ATP-binding protein [Pseudolabrys sp.]
MSSDSSSEVVIRCEGIGKAYQLHSTYNSRIWQALFGGAHKFYKDYWVLRGIDLQVTRGQSVGIMGRNGAGKSTLLQVICGITQPTEGKLETVGRIAPVLALGAGFDMELTGRENARIGSAILGLRRSEAVARLDSIADFAALGEFFDQPIKYYSSGMVSRLSFAVCAHSDADILIVDEALAVGDQAFQKKCFDFIDDFRRRGTLLFVSHNERQVMRLCDRVIWIERGSVRAAGTPAEVAQAYLETMRIEKDNAARFAIGA